MSTELLELEITELKKRVAALEGLRNPEKKGNWMRAVGALKDAKHMDEAVRIGEELRKKANEEGR